MCPNPRFVQSKTIFCKFPRPAFVFGVATIKRIGIAYGDSISFRQRSKEHSPHRKLIGKHGCQRRIRHTEQSVIRQSTHEPSIPYKARSIEKSAQPEVHLPQVGLLRKSFDA